MPYTPRTIAVIKQQILDQIPNYTVLAPFTSNTSAVALFNNFAFIVAVGISLFEQLIPIFQDDIEVTVTNAPPGSDPWLQDKVLKFQYDATTPQVLSLINLVPQYAIVNPAYRIISRCAITTGSNNTVQVKVATGEPPAALSGPQLTALQSYLTDGGDGTYAGRSVGLGFAGINYLAVSRVSDKLYLAGTIYYNGQYGSTISADCVAALNNYLTVISSGEFKGAVTLLGISDALQSVNGFEDVLFTDIAMRPDATAFASKTFLINNKTTLITNYPSYAGYVIQENTSGQTWTDKLVFQAI